MDIAIYTLTSELHDEKAVTAATQEFLNSLDIGEAGWHGACPYIFRGDDYTDYGSYALNLIFVRTGGTEGIFARLLPQLKYVGAGPVPARTPGPVPAPTHHPFYLLTSGKSNSLAASMEILSYLQQQGLHGEIIHGSPAYVSQRIRLLETVGNARRRLQGTRLGIIGKPSDWLISSTFDRVAVRDRLGIDLIDIPMSELIDAIAVGAGPVPARNEGPVPGGNTIYEALKGIVEKHSLQGFTLRCFDLLTAVKDTGCLALAKLNAEGLVAGCEGDVPAMLSMMITRELTGVSGFQANPAFIDTEKGEMVFAHCTIPLDMVERYELNTHFESGIGVAIRGFMKEGDVTIFKVSGDMKRSFIAEGQLVRNETKPDLCRTQQRIRLLNACTTSIALGGLPAVTPCQADYFLTQPIGNHHIIMPGHHKEELLDLMVSTLIYGEASPQS